MRAEDVPAEWVYDFMRELIAAGPPVHVGTKAIAHALAAVAPTIAAAERERCARVAHQHGYDLANLDERNGAFSAAAALRALGDADG